MTAAEKAAQLHAYKDVLAMLKHHARLCAQADNLVMDLDDSIQRRMAEVEAMPETDEPARRGRGKGHG